MLLFAFIIKFGCVVGNSFWNAEASWVHHAWTTLPNLHECCLVVYKCYPISFLVKYSFTFYSIVVRVDFYAKNARLGITFTDHCKFLLMEIKP